MPPPRAATRSTADAINTAEAPTTVFIPPTTKPATIDPLDETGEPRRRRRRRGGRRHRRRNGEPAGSAEGESSDQPIDESSEESEPASEPTPQPVAEVPAPVIDTPAEPEQLSLPGVETEPAAAPTRSRRTRAKAAPAVVDEPDTDESAPAPKAKKAKRATKAKASAKATPKRTPPRKKAAPADVEPVEVVSTGSADTHVVDDDPVDAAPLRRPRSYSDLDAIPDDYD